VLWRFYVNYPLRHPSSSVCNYLRHLTNQLKGDKIVRTFQVALFDGVPIHGLEEGNMCNPEERSRRINFLVRLFVACLLLCGLASAAPSITLSKKTGPPTSRIEVSGRGFEPNVRVDIFFDTKDEALVVTNSKGEFNKAGAYAPRSAHPGEHWISALERSNDKGAQKPFLVRTDWAQFHFTPDHKGLNPYENVLDPSVVGSLGLKWSSQLKASSSPAVENGLVYFGCADNTVHALRASTGKEAWSYATLSSVDSSPAVADGVVYVGSDDNNVYALNARTGGKLWSFATQGAVQSAPAVANGVVYVSSNDFNVYALNARTGARLWSYTTGSYIQSSTAVVDGVVYVGSNDKNIYALNASTGALLWSYNTFGGVFSSPVVSNGVVYFGSFDNGVYALNASNGTILWSFYTNGLVYSSPAVANGVVYVGSDDKNLYALDAVSGAKLWTYTTNSDVDSSPVVADGVVYVGSDDSNIYALDASTGGLLWSYTTGSVVRSSPAVVNGVVYVIPSVDNVYAFGLASASPPQIGHSKPAEASIRTDPRTLRSDFNLKVSKPDATP